MFVAMLGIFLRIICFTGLISEEGRWQLIEIYHNLSDVFKNGYPLSYSDFWYDGVKLNWDVLTTSN